MDNNTALTAPEAKVRRGNKMKKLLISVIILPVIFLSSCIRLPWTTEISSYYYEPYTLLFEQVGDPDFPFGETHIRLSLYEDGRRICFVNEDISDDGANASPGSVKSVTWGSSSVAVVLQGSEMDDKTVVLEYGK